MNFRILVAALLVVGCATTTQPAATKPDLTRPEGGLLVAMTSATATPAPKVDGFARFVQDSTGLPTRGVIFPDYDSLAEAIAAGKVDIAFLSPLAFVRASDTAKVDAVLRAVRHGRDTYRAVLFARKDSPVRDLATLKAAKDLRAAWVDPSSATGYMFPKALMVEHQIDPVRVFVSQDFLGSHQAVCDAVAGGKADVGGTYIDDPAATTVEGCRSIGPERLNGLAIVAVTEDIPNDVLATRPGFPEEPKGRLLIGATALNNSEEGKQTLLNVFSAEAFSQIKRDDYEVVRRAVEVFRP